MRIVFWQNILAFYQAPHIRALAERGDTEVIWVAAETLTRDRKALGWSPPEAGRARVVVSPDDAELQRLALAKPEESVHIFTGIGAFPLVHRAFQACLPTQARMGLLVENRDDRGWKGLGRLISHRRDYYRYGKRISFILAMGYTGPHGGQQWYRRCGYRHDQVFPYGYFPDPPPQAVPIEPFQPAPQQPVRLIFLGQCIPRKGVDILLQSLASLTDLAWSLHVVGDGSHKAEWMELSRRCGIADRVQFMPVMANEQAMAAVAERDIFLLPSRFDGWGVVVNEALLRGVPVICSDRCGAQDLLSESWRGETFPAGSVTGLREVLGRWICNGKNTQENSRRIREWSRCIHGDVAADYLLGVLACISGTGPRPQPPWLKAYDVH